MPRSPSTGCADFDLYNAALTEHFGPDVVSVVGSGIDDIVAPPVRGRRRNPRLEVNEGKGVKKITTIVCQVMELHTNVPYVCVTIQSPHLLGFHSELTQETLQWWGKNESGCFLILISSLNPSI